MSEEEKPAAYQVRRATLEDLPELKRLWEASRLSVDELEKRFTEFQIALDQWGQIAGSIGLKISKTNGLIHSETFTDLNQVSEIRPLLWERIVNVAKNHGLVRLWALPTTSFYRDMGMTDVDDTLKAALPEGFGNPFADWLTLKLKEDLPANAIEKEFELFFAAQKDASEKMIRQAAALKFVAYILLVLAIAGASFLAIFAFKRDPRRRR